MAHPLKGYTRLDANVEGLLEYQEPTLVAGTGEANSGRPTKVIEFIRNGLKRILGSEIVEEPKNRGTNNQE